MPPSGSLAAMSMRGSAHLGPDGLIRNPRRWLIVIVLFHVVLAAGFARVIYPIDDEAYYASPAANLALKGHFGTTTYENTSLPTLAERTYWIVPVYPALLAGWFHVFGVGLSQQRSLSVLFGGLAVGAWYWIVFGLSKDARVALGAAALVAIDHTLLSAANGRPDLMGSAWGVLGMAGYVSLREHRLVGACFLAYLGAVLAGLTHPLPGVLAFANTTLLIVLLDRHRFDLKALAAAVVPFALGAVALALYVHPYWHDAYVQFGWNTTVASTDGVGRFNRHLLATWWRVAGFVMEEFLPVPGSSPVAWLKMVIPLTYAVVVVVALAVPRVRRSPAVLVLLVIVLTDCLLLPLIAGYQKWQYYMHILVLFPPVVVVVLATLWRGRASAYRLLVVVVALTSGTVLLQSVRIVHSLKEDSLGTWYQASATRLRQPPFDKGTFWGKAYWGYAVGLDRLTEDSAFGYFSHKRKDFLILSLDQRGTQGDMPRGYLGDYLRGMLTQEYTLLYEDQAIRVYGRRPVQ